jgi:hypothetical protein
MLLKKSQCAISVGCCDAANQKTAFVKAEDRRIELGVISRRLNVTKHLIER